MEELSNDWVSAYKWIEYSTDTIPQRLMLSIRTNDRICQTMSDERSFFQSLSIKDLV